MKTVEIYSKYEIPSNLQTHMLRVSSLGFIITSNFNTSIDQDTIIKTLLLHDMGNIIKFDLTKPNLLDQTDKNRIDQLKQVQQKFKMDYGKTPDDATLAIIKEIGVKQSIYDLCQQSHWENTSKFINTNQWDKKICIYSDMRIGPFGILNIKDRITDLMHRRPKEKTSLKTLLNQAQQIEKEIQSHLSLDLNKINQKDLETNFNYLLNLDI